MVGQHFQTHFCIVLRIVVLLDGPGTPTQGAKRGEQGLVQDARVEGGVQVFGEDEHLRFPLGTDPAPDMNFGGMLDGGQWHELVPARTDTMLAGLW
eukprot:GAFH01002320.1.p5 GENE.GAFH01002320.1~~GAFH01002320.1.p5  ORF type:complete len:96 (+),score=13.88 GAFH01002320.1:199-486(+)